LVDSGAVQTCGETISVEESSYNLFGQRVLAEICLG